MPTESQQEPIVHQAIRTGDLHLLHTAMDLAPELVDTPCDDFTPLQLAVWRGETEMVEMLLAAGANPNRTQSDGMLPLDRAIDFGLESIINLLQNNGAITT